MMENWTCKSADAKTVGYVKEYDQAKKELTQEGSRTGDEIKMVLNAKGEKAEFYLRWYFRAYENVA